MSRAPVVVRQAVPEDACAVIELWTSEASARGARVELDVTEDCPRVLEAAGCIATIALDPEQQLLVAEADNKVIGAVHLRRGPISPVSLAEAVHVAHLHVSPSGRRRGIASTLLAAATDWADEKDNDHLIAVAPASSREAHRFLARLGFTQVAVVRAVATAALRHRFTTAATAFPETNRLLATRRTLRRRREQLATG